MSIPKLKKIKSEKKYHDLTFSDEYAWVDQPNILDVLKDANKLDSEVKDYIRFIANRRLSQLGLEPIYKVEKNPLGWLDTMLNAVEHMNFFEGRATEYSKASTQGTWAEAFS